MTVRHARSVVIGMLCLPKRVRFAARGRNGASTGTGITGYWGRFGILLALVMAPLFESPLAQNTSARGSGRLLTLPKLSDTELGELLTTLRIHLETESDYQEQSSPPSSPRGITNTLHLVREGNATISLGTLVTLSQPPRLWLKGEAPLADNPAAPNPDLDTIAALVDQILPEIAATKAALTRQDLSHQIVQLDYIDVAGALEALKGFGFTTFAKASEIPASLTFDQLPLVAPMPEPSIEQKALLGKIDGSKLRGSFDLSVTPSVATELPDSANMSPSSRLIILSHPAHPDQYSRVLKILQEAVDRPARQIFVEGLVLEISEDGLKELGVEWQFNEGNFAQTAGTLTPGVPNPTPTLDFTFDDLKNLDQNWIIKVRSLLEEGKAEILSRPSILTLNNRQATIRVGTDIPIATAQEGLENSNKIAFTFKYLATGISLNIRPRITASGEEVGMLIDTIVSSVVPGGDLQLRSTSDEVLASAPTVATRRVQTYARIENNTPFIIGGLVSKEQTRRLRKVPVLGEIPYLGRLFRSTSSRSSKREVIIVLTPYVLVNDKTSRALGRFLPKDEDRFDEFGNVLFRDFYRIRNEDVFDLEFLTEDPRLKSRLERVKAAVAANRDLEKTPEFARFSGDLVPGEEVLVQRMIYEVIKRLSSEPKTGEAWLANRAGLDRIIIFEKQNVGGYEVAFLDELLKQYGDGETSESFFTRHPGKALLIQFVSEGHSGNGITLEKDPIPTISLVDCPDEAAWTQLLATSNQPTADGREQHAIVIHEPGDLVRLRRAVLLDKVVQLNGGKDRINLLNFSLGKVLLIPEPDTDKVHLLDPQTAQYFYHTEHYYGALLRQLTEALDRAEAALNNP